MFERILYYYTSRYGLVTTLQIKHALVCEGDTIQCSVLRFLMPINSEYGNQAFVLFGRQIKTWEGNQQKNCTGTKRRITKESRKECRDMGRGPVGGEITLIDGALEFLRPR